MFKAQRRPPKVVDQLPQGYVPVYRYKDRRRHRPEYYYYRGRYYRPHGHRYITAYPPSGVVVPLLPLGYRTLVYGGVPYYYYDDIYYTQVPSGYLVVDPPSDPALSPQPPPPASPYGPVTVIAEALNVRSGPGRQYEVVAVVRRGETYGVQAIAPEWLYILLPDGQAGWVQEIYTAPAMPQPSG